MTAEELTGIHNAFSVHHYQILIWGKKTLNNIIISSKRHRVIPQSRQISLHLPITQGEKTASVLSPATVLYSLPHVLCYIPKMLVATATETG